MNTCNSLLPSGHKLGAFGGLVWLISVAGTFLTAFSPNIFDSLFLLAPWVIVPLCLGLVPDTGITGVSRVCVTAVRYLFFPAAALTRMSLFSPAGPKAGAYTGLWLIVCIALALVGLGRLIRTRLKSFPEFCFAFGEGYALVGALWLLASRLGMHPAGFHEPIVLLTAIHFHYAGLMAAVLAGLTASTIPMRLPFRVALSCAVLGPGLLGLAFLVGPKLKLAAVGLMVIGECGIAFGTFRIGLTAFAKTSGRLLLFASACVIFGMVLAGVWAVGEYPLHAFVNLEQMARYHGVLNSVGFGLCSLVGWTLLRRQSQPASERT